MPQYQFLLSVITPAGHELAEKQALPFLDELIYSPFDLSWVTRKVVRSIKPAVFISLESEMWPNLLHTLKQEGARTILANGRFTEKNFGRTLTYGRGLFQWMMSNMDLLLMQSEAEAERARMLGADPAKVQVLGNSKFDQPVRAVSAKEAAELRVQLHLPKDSYVWIAGSTRSPEEEYVVVEAHKLMKKKIPNLCLIAAPRQITRAEEVEKFLSSQGLSPALRTRLNEAPEQISCMVLDTMGELAGLYAAADMAFIGNTFPPVVQGGGQNLLQPLAHGIPVLIGPKIATIRAEVAMGLEAGVVYPVTSAETMAEAGIQLLKDGLKREEIKKKALHLISVQQGASGRYACAVAELMRETSIS